MPIDQIRSAVSNLAAELSARLGENKNVAVGLLLTEAGIAVKEIAANEEIAEVVGAVITEEATVVGAAVATADGVAYQIVGETKDGVATEVGVITDQGTVVVDAVAVNAAEAPAIDAAPPTTAADAAAEPAAPLRRQRRKRRKCSRAGKTVSVRHRVSS